MSASTAGTISYVSAGRRPAVSWLPVYTQGETVPESCEAMVFEDWSCCPMYFSLQVIKILDSCNL